MLCDFGVVECGVVVAGRGVVWCAHVVWWGASPWNWYKQAAVPWHTALLCSHHMRNVEDLSLWWEAGSFAQMGTLEKERLTGRTRSTWRWKSSFSTTPASVGMRTRFTVDRARSCAEGGGGQGG